MDRTLEDEGGEAAALEDDGGMVALGGGFGWQLKIAVVVLGGGCGRRTCDDGIGISIVKAEGYCHNVGVSIDKNGKRGHVQCEGRMLASMAMR